MSDRRDDDLDAMTTAQVDASGQPIDPGRNDAPQPAPTDDTADGPTVPPEEEEVAAQLGDFA